MSNLKATIVTLSKTATEQILKQYRDDASKLVLTLAPFRGKGHTGASVYADVTREAARHGIDIPARFKATSINNALATIRVMNSLPESLKSDPTLAAALIKIVWATGNGYVGGGKKTAEQLAIDVTALNLSDAETVAMISAASAEIVKAWNLARTAPKTPAATADTAPADTADADTDTADNVTPDTVEAPARAVAALALASVSELMAEIDRRLMEGHTLTSAEYDRFNDLAVAVEANAVELIDA